MNILNYLNFLYLNLKSIDDEYLLSKTIFETLSNISYDFRINQTNYLEFANSNFTFDISNNWLYDRKVYEVSHAYAKLYIPLKPNYFFKAIKEFVDIVEKIRELNIGLGQTKFRVNPSNDAVILRFQTQEALIEALKLIENNNILKESIDTPNLFIPNINGIGFSSDAGGSYILIVELILTDYIKTCIANCSKPSLESFRRFIENIDFMKNLLIAKMCDYDEDIMYDYKDTLIGKINSENDKKLIKKMLQ